MPNAALNGIDVHHEHRSDGPPLLFLNGPGSNIQEAEPMLDRLRSHFDVLAHDRRRVRRASVADAGGHGDLYQDRRRVPDVTEFLLGSAV